MLTCMLLNERRWPRCVQVMGAPATTASPYATLVVVWHLTWRRRTLLSHGSAIFLSTGSSTDSRPFSPAGCGDDWAVATVALPQVLTSLSLGSSPATRIHQVRSRPTPCLPFTAVRNRASKLKQFVFVSDLIGACVAEEVATGGYCIWFCFWILVRLLGSQRWSMCCNK